MSKSGVKTRAAVVGARGYSGLELCKILLRHPSVELISCYATGAFELSNYLSTPRALGIPGRPIEALLTSVLQEKIDLVFLATPAETSMELAPKILEAGAHVIDLSGAFRLQEGDREHRRSLYKQWYGFDHQAQGWLTDATFGLQPWASKSAVISGGMPRLISNPGCFSTATLMALLPLVKGQLIDASHIVVDAKSGTTGAGKKAEERLLHAEVNGNCLPYRIGRHQHEPEIAQTLRREMDCKTEFSMFFTPHLLDVRRGIIASVYCRTDKSLKQLSQDDRYDRIVAAYREAYANDPLVSVEPLKEPGADQLLSLRRVVGTARTHIAFELRDENLYVFSLIDNLLKGAASQAVENMNCLIGLPASTGLIEMENLV